MSHKKKWLLDLHSKQEYVIVKAGFIVFLPSVFCFSFMFDILPQSLFEYIIEMLDK